MANAVLRLVGNTTREPELRFTPGGSTVCKFGLAVTDRVRDKATDKWVDGPTSFYDVTVWGQPAENVAESIGKGDRVWVEGRCAIDTYEKDGQTQRKVVVTADEVGPSLRFATCKIVRPERRPSPVADSGDEPF
jgi:single-strand DNA-binding protein